MPLLIRALDSVEEVGVKVLLHWMWEVMMR